MIKFIDIEYAFHCVSSDEGLTSAVINKNTGQILFRSDMTGIDEIGEDYLDPETWIDIPHKHDLDLGQRLVFEFVEDRLPDDYDELRQIFQKRGAYRRFKGLLRSRRLGAAWNDFQSQREEQAIRAWCAENKIDISD